MKAKMAQSTSQMTFDVSYNESGSIHEIRGSQDGGVEGMRLYIITEDLMFDELDDDETVDNCNIKDGDKLYLLFYSWTSENRRVKVTKTSRKLHGVNRNDTCLGIKLRVQDQTGLHVSTLKLIHVEHGQYELKYYLTSFPKVKGIHDQETPFKDKGVVSLLAISDEEFNSERIHLIEERRAEDARRAEQWRAQQAERDERRRMMLAAAASKAGLTVEEYNAVHGPLQIYSLLQEEWEEQAGNKGKQN